MGLLDDLISKHVKRRELLLVDKSMEGREKRFRRRPFITVWREAGSGGRPVAQAVAKKLGFKFYDRKIIELTAKKAKRRENLIASLDERERGLVDDLVHSLLNPDYVSEQSYIKSLCEVMLSLVHKGACVLLGRGGNFVTSQYGGLHVRIAAPFLVRAGYTAQYEDYTIFKAKDRVKKFDQRRKEFIKQYFGKDPSNDNYYDLVVNTTYFNINEARDIVVAAFVKKFPDWKKFR